MRIGLRFALVPWLAATAGSAQTPAPPELIDHLIANAQLYAASLPSISATETIDSEGGALIFRRHMQAKGIFRVIRDPATGVLSESRQFTEVDGKPVEPGHRVNLPWTLGGGFGRFQEIFFTPARKPCYSFTLRPQLQPGGTEQIDIAERPPEQLSDACRQSSRGFTGFVRVDPVARQVVYVERTVPAEFAARYQLALFASVEVAPAQIGEETFWLPAAVVGIIVNGAGKGRFTAHYSNYHRYTGSVTILPGVTKIEGDELTPAPPAKPSLLPPPPV